MLKTRRFWIGLAITLLFLVLLFYRSNPSEILVSLKNANYILTLPAVALYFIGFWFRVVRWAYVVRPLKVIPSSKLFSITIIGYAVNNLLPLRIGELVRAYLIGEREGVSKSAALGTIVVERIFDGLALIFFILVVSLFIPMADWLRALTLATTAIFVGFLAVFIFLGASPGRTEKAIFRLTRFLPQRWGKLALGVAASFVEGLKILQSPARLLVVFGYSLLFWAIEAAMSWVLAFGFNVSQPYPVFVIGTATANLSTTLPSTQGGIGPFEYFFKESLVLFGTPDSLATTYAVVLHAVLLIPLIILGVIYLWTGNVSLGQLTRRSLEVKRSPVTPPEPNLKAATSSLNVAVIGAGIGGLTAAYELTKAGHRVTVFEKDARLGGQLAAFDIGEQRLDKFYHHIFKSDRAVIELMKELGISGQLQWLPSTVGFYYGDRTYSFASPVDLLRFKPLGLIDRLRLGLLSLYLQRLHNWSKLESQTVKQWTIKNAGKRNYDIVWGPMLRAKFGDKADDVGMAWLWGRIFVRLGSREKGMQQEVLGYLQGSFGLLVDELTRKVEARGGRILSSTMVESINTQDGKVTGVQTLKGVSSFDHVICTGPSDSFLKITPGLPDEYIRRLQAATYQAAQCLILVLKQRLTPFYWTNIADASLPFTALIEHTNFVQPEVYGGIHIIYLPNYLKRDSPVFQLSKEELLEKYLPFLRRFNPQFTPGWVEQSFLFREPAAQPVVPVNYSAIIPDLRTPIRGLYLANTTQIYPEDRGINYSVRLGQKVSKLLADDSLP